MINDIMEYLGMSRADAERFCDNNSDSDYAYYDYENYNSEEDY